jgi:hypothetical protein
MEMRELESLVGRLAEQQLALTKHVDDFQREIGAAVIALAHGQKQFMDETKEAIKSLAEAQTRLTEAQQHTEERLNALITVVDGLIHRPPVQ